MAVCLLTSTAVLLSGCGSKDSPTADTSKGGATTSVAKADGDVEVDAGLQLMEQRQFAKARPHFEQALSKSLAAYTKSDVLTMLGNCFNDLELYQESLDCHAKAIQEDPQNYKAYVNQGVVHRLLGDYEAAAASYAMALKLKPEYAELHASLGALSIFQAEYGEAVSHLERAVALDDSLAVPHSNLAIAYAAVGEYDKADAELKKAVSRGYHQPEAVEKRIEQLRVTATTSE